VAAEAHHAHAHPAAAAAYSRHVAAGGTVEDRETARGQRPLLVETEIALEPGNAGEPCPE
jgi:hypothetical protein